MTDQIQRAPQRLAYIDWMRGLACVLMFQTHCYDSWLSPEARNSALMAWSRLGGTLPAPLFIFLAGISVALVTEKMREKGIDRGAIATPPLWTTHRPRFLPWPLESYINGVHIFKEPQPWLFPLFPWTAFAFAGLAVGFFVFSQFARRREGLAFAALAGTGIVAMLLSMAFDSSPIRLYAVYDYWHSGPNFFLMRCGILLVILFLVYAWCRWGFAQKGFSPLIQLGKTSLLVYWVHIEFVYGRFSILPKGQCSQLKATGGLIVIFLAMLALSLLRTSWKKRTVSASR